MSYTDYDISESLGAPLDLYRFTYNDTVYRYCTLDGGVASYTLGSETYTAISIGRSGTEMSEDIQRTALELRAPRNIPLVELFFLGPPEGVVGVTVLRLHLTDPDINYVTVFKGRIGSCSLQVDEATLRCEPIFSSLKRPGLRRMYETQCVHGLFQPGCNLLRDDWAWPGSILDAEGIDVVVQEAGNKPDGWFKGGELVSGSVRRMIVEHVGVNITLMHPVRTDIIGAACILYPGCDHTLGPDGCHKYLNNINSMNCAWLPLKNPFTGDNVFW